MAPLFTIITPCLNSEATVAETIRSVATQTCGDFEHVIVDGQSRDRTWEIVLASARADPRIRPVQHRDRSMTEALNRGLALARGRIVGSLNADDRYHPDALAAVAQAWRGGGFRVVVGNVRIEDPARRPLYRQRPWPVVSALSWHALGCITPECSVFIHRSCLAHVGGFDERFRLAQDFELYLRLSRRYRFRHVDRTLSSFTAHPGQLSAEHAPALAAEVAAYYPHPWVRRVLVESALGSLLPILIGVRRYTARQRARLARARWQRLRAWPLRLS